ncbi:MAG: hypothetical protein Q8T11_12385 [Elusimicrobiota bacterium]|nr:hypothetical protein [Elusimicrobiota bacterium]
MKCPICGVDAPAGAVDCAACGIIFAKFKKKLESLPVTPASRFQPWMGRALAVVIVLAWMAGFGLYYRAVLSEMPARKTAAPR